MVSSNPISPSFSSQLRSVARNHVRGKRPRQSNPEQPQPKSAFSATLEKDVGGLWTERDELRQLLSLPLFNSEYFRNIGITPARGILIHGPSGVGKSLIVQAASGSLGVPLFRVSCASLIRGVSGESESAIRQCFEDAREIAPCILQLDDVELIAGRRDRSEREMERRMVTQLLQCLDELRECDTRSQDIGNTSGSKQAEGLVVVGTTSRPEVLDPALRRGGRFDKELALRVPSLKERRDILRVLTSKLTIQPEQSLLDEMAEATPGFLGADLMSLVQEAGAMAVQRKVTATSKGIPSINSAPPSSEEVFRIEPGDFARAVRTVQPSALREGFSTVPSVTWKDVGGLEDVRESLMQSVVRPINLPSIHAAAGLSRPVGVLLHGPPGCGKTLVAKAIANESSANFICVNGPELLNKFVGESEASVRSVFRRARTSAPCVLFFDELDALAPTRSTDNSNPATERVVNQLLTELDGVAERRGVFVLGATNRKDKIDEAMLRPGRLDLKLEVPLPNASQRVSILRACARHYPLDSSVDLDTIGRSEALTGFSGADLEFLLRKAATATLDEFLKSLRSEDALKLERKLSSNIDDPMGATRLKSNTEEHVNSVIIRQKQLENALRETLPSLRCS